MLEGREECYKEEREECYKEETRRVLEGSEERSVRRKRREEC